MVYKQSDIMAMVRIMENPWFLAGIILLAIWSIIWKGTALWKAARNSHKVWFIVLLLVNTVGILEILYICFFSKKGCCCCKEEKEQN